MLYGELILDQALQILECTAWPPIFLRHSCLNERIHSSSATHLEADLGDERFLPETGIGDVHINDQASSLKEGQRSKT